MKSMVDFKEPNTVPVESLSDGYDPTKKRFNSLKTLINWRGQNYIEDFKPVVENENIQPDVEINDFRDNNADNLRRNIEVIRLTEPDSKKEVDTV